jgi:hypothetical protein
MNDLIFLALQAYLQTQVPEFKEMEWYNHNYDEMGNTFQIASPGLYIEFAGMTCADMADGSQDCDILINFHIMEEFMVGFDALAHYALVKKVYKALQRHAFLLSDVPVAELTALKNTDGDAALTGDFTRVGQRPDHTYQNLVGTITQFEVSARDFSACQEWEWLNGIALDGKKFEE